MKDFVNTIKFAVLAALTMGFALGAQAAKMTADFTLQITPTDSGTATFNGESWSSGEKKTSNLGELTVIVDATCEDGYEFVGWSVNPTDASFDYPTAENANLSDFTMGGSYTVTATFKKCVEPVEYTAPTYVDNVASNGIAYWTTNTVSTFTVVTSAVGAVTWGAAGVTNWYVVTNGEFQIDGNVTCAGHVNLVLCDGANLTVAGTETNAAAIATDTSGSFTVYGSTVGNGHLVVTASTAGPDADKPGSGAGIGGGKSVAGKNITINGGFIEATGGQRGPGIGSGGYAGAGDNNIVINGGLVKANCSGEYGAGIGGGTQGYVKGVVINGGTVIATGGKRSAGIGSGAQAKGTSADITINGGYVVATGGNKDDTISAIGQGYDPNSKVSPTASGIRVSTAMKILADDNYPPTTEIANAGGDLTSAFAEKRYAIIRMPTEYTDDCLTFSSDGAFTLSATDQKWDGVLWTSTDKATWTVWNAATVAAAQTGGTGDYRLHVRGDIRNTKINDPFSGYYWKLTPAGDNKIACTGNIETLRGATGDAPSPTPMAPFCYANLFRYCASLTSAPTLPATNLSMRCYGCLFLNCTSLTEAPALPAVNLYEWCYESMFFGCSSLTSAPSVLPAMDLAMACYQDMFNGCTSLPAAPALPATNLAVKCYSSMFTDCTSLTSAPPVLAAMTLTESCYAGMFMGCTSLTAAPALPATNLAFSCYAYMFRFCHSLTSVPPVLPATDLAKCCYLNMFYECTSLTDIPALPATNMAIDCYDGMFSGCTSLTTVPALPIANLETNCCSSMFYACTSLTDIPALPVTVLKQYCYQKMFCDCSNLVINTTGPGRPWSLPAEAEASTNDAPNWGGYPDMYMFTRTGGDVPELPVFGQTYYIASARTTVTPQAVAHTTFKVYTNGTDEVSSPYEVTWGATVKVVYTAESGYVFADGTTEWSATFAAEGDPASVPEAQLPAAPMVPVKYLAPTYKGTDGNPTNGIAYWTTNTCASYTVVTSATSAVTWGSAGVTNWYVVTNANVQIDGGVKCFGRVNLILGDGAKLTVQGGDRAAGIETDADGLFAVYGQPDGAGELVAQGGGEAAGIGGKYDCLGANIVLNGGKVTATGGTNSAGIGGGKYGSVSAGATNIVINGGTVTAMGGLSAAAIGGGIEGFASDITINGGTVIACGDARGAAIGAGIHHSATNITINAGTLYLQGALSAYVGDGYNSGTTGSGNVLSAAANIFFNATGDEVTPAFSGRTILTPEMIGSAGVGGERLLMDGLGAQGLSALPSFVLTNAVTGATAEIAVNGAPLGFANKMVWLEHADGTLTLKYERASNISPADIPNTTHTILTNGVDTGLAVLTVATGTVASVVYRADPGFAFADSSLNMSMAVTNVVDTNYDPASVPKPSKPVRVVEAEYVAPVYVDNVASNGIDHWITNTALCFVVEDATNAVQWGVQDVVTWYAVTNANGCISAPVKCWGNVNLVLCEGGRLTVTNAASNPGIDVAYDNSLKIYGQSQGAGVLSAKGADGGAGIGSGVSDVCQGGITVNGGTVTAIGGNGAAGIGGGNWSAAWNITINGGTVTAMGGGYAAAIGGGYDRKGKNIVLNGGTVFVSAPMSDEDGKISCGELIGSGSGKSSEGAVISSAARVFFNLTGLCDGHGRTLDPVAAMPADFEGFVVMTPGTQTVSRVLVGGCGGLIEAALPSFVLTNAVTGATDPLEVNGAKTTFAGTYCCLTNDNENLTFAILPPVLTVTQQPGVANAYTIVAETDGNNGITNYAWCVQNGTTTGFVALTNALEAATNVVKITEHGGIEGTAIKSNDEDDEFMMSLAWLPDDNAFEITGIPKGGKLHFTCASDISVGDAEVVGPIRRIGETDEWVWEAKLYDVSEGEGVFVYMLPLSAAGSFTIDNLRWITVDYAPVAQGQTMKALPADVCVVGKKYVCRMDYGHEGVYYTGDSDVFTYILPEPILAQPTPVEHATFVVYTNGFISTEVEPGKWAAWSNRTATVVYTAEGDYYFDGGLKAVTNELDTTKNPAVNKGDLPAVLDPIKYLAPVYVDNIASNGIAYWTTNTCYSYTVVTGAENEVMWGSEEATSWYVVKDGDYQVDGRVVCLGHINLILCEGAKLVVTNAPSDSAGIETYEDGSFTIHGQPNGAGTLETMGGDGGAALGGSYNRVGSCITINGGTVLAVGGYNGAGVGGGRSGEGRFITINGGTVMATGGSEAPGIGSGAYRDTTDITINGGIVTAYGRNGSAGIGSSWYSDASHIVINGGTVTAYGSEGAAGVGGGYFGEGRDIAINGGTVTAVGGYHAAGIGGGECRNGFDISINGGAVTAISGNRSAAIGGGYAAGGYDITISNAVVFVCAVPEDYYGEIIVSDVIGNGCECEDPASGIVIDSSAKVFFNLMGLWDGRDNVWSQPMAEMPADFEDFTIMTPGKLSVDRVLVNGLSAAAFQSSIFNLTNAMSGSTGTIEVDGASEVAFAGMFCSLTNDSGKLTLKVRPPMVDITQQPHMTNGYVIAATTDAEDGFVNYAWYRSGGAKVYDFLSAWDANEDAQVYFHGERHGTTLFSTWDDDYGCHCIELAWNVEELGLPTNGVLRFTCSDDFSYPNPIGTFTRDGDEWTFTPNDVRSYVETSFCTYDLCLFIDAPISNLRWVIPNGDSYESVETLIAEGASMTTFPAGQGEDGSNYFCRITYAHVGAQYTTDSEEFAYAAPSVFAIDSHTLTVGTEPTAGGTIAVTNEAAVGADVAVKAYPGLYWQFNYWEGSNVVNGTSLTFVNKFAADTTFEMPAADVDVTAIFALSEPYRAERLNALSVAALDAAMQVRTTLTLSPAEMDAIFAKIIAANDVAEAAIRAAYTPTQVQDAEAAANAVFAAAVNEAEDTAEAKVRFEASELSVTEGTSSFALVVYGGSTNRSTAVNVSFVKNTYTKKPKAYMIVDGVEKKVKFPITLDWAKGDRLPKKIRLEFKSNKKAEVDKYFTLQLGSEVACAVGPIGICRVTVKDQTEVSGSDYPYVRALAWPVNGGKANGSGYVKKATATRTLRAKAKKWAKFDGWYRASTNAPNDFAQAEFVTSEAKFKVAQGDVGTYFAHYVDVTPVIAVNDPDFTAEGVKGVTANDEGIATCKVGEPVSFPMTYTADPDSKPKLSVKKLPKGLKYDRKTGLVSGTPKKSGSFTAQAKGRNTPGKHTLKIKFEVQ